jgi:transcriptional repressor NrdR
MRCPYCKANNDRVVDSRTSGEADVIRRRRECLECGGRFTTYEKAGEATLRVVKKDGSRVPFDREKLLEGLLVACHKRPIETSALESIVTDIESQLHEMFDKEVASKFIGHLIMEALRGLDQVAYVRFASVYREFKDVNQFLDELKPLLGIGDADRGGPRPQKASEPGGPDALDGSQSDADLSPSDTPDVDSNVRPKGPAGGFKGARRALAVDRDPAEVVGNSGGSAKGASDVSATGAQAAVDGGLRAPER